MPGRGGWAFVPGLERGPWWAGPRLPMTTSPLRSQERSDRPTEKTGLPCLSRSQPLQGGGGIYYITTRFESVDPQSRALLCELTQLSKKRGGLYITCTAATRQAPAIPVFSFALLRRAGTFRALRDPTPASLHCRLCGKTHCAIGGRRSSQGPQEDLNV